MENIGIKLKEIRESKKMSRKNVADKLKERGINISDKTLYGYEVGRTAANADMLLALCDIYGVKDILGTFYDAEPSIDKEVLLNPSEQEFIKKFRQIDNIGQENILKQLDSEIGYTRLREYANTMLDSMKKDREG